MYTIFMHTLRNTNTWDHLSFNFMQVKTLKNHFLIPLFLRVSLSALDIQNSESQTGLHVRIREFLKILMLCGYIPNN